MIIILSGQRIPIQPTTVQTVNITSASATVQWLIPYISYTPEHYTIDFGTAREMLHLRSPTLSSSTDISALNITYALTLQALVPNTVYFFQLQSVNTYGETTTPVMMFATLEAGI